MNSRRQLRTTSFTASLVLASALTSCASGPTQYQSLALNAQELEATSQKPAYLQPRVKKLFQEGKRNEVLNHMEIGTAAFYNGDLAEARASFDAVLSRIETVYADNPEAHQARSLWHEEGRKDFKGEPYERAMAYYYRGLIYLIDSDYDNARASFVSGLMQDAFAEEEQHRSDLAMLMLLSGWAAQKMGSPGLAQEAYEELRAHRPEFPVPSPEDNVLVIAETGTAPRKLADGVGHYELVFRQGKNFRERALAITRGDHIIDMLPLESVYFQATSRGGRPIDAIIEGKAAFRSANAEMGNALADLGVAASVYSPVTGGGMANVGNALALVGVTQMALSANAKPRADTRYWSNLPDTLHVSTFQAPGEGDLSVDQWQVEYKDADDNPLPMNPGISRHYRDKNGNHLIWHSSQPRN